MVWTDIELSDKALMEPYLNLDGEIMGDRCFASLYIWGEHYKHKKSIKDGFLYILSDLDERVYHMPLGDGNMEDALREIEEDAAGRPYRIALITKKNKEVIENTGRYVLTEDRANFDYIYNADDLIHLPGKKFHSKHNFINRFLKEHSGRWEYKDVCPERDRDEILAFLKEWCEKKHDETDDYEYEYSAIHRALDSFRELEMRGGILKVDGMFAAFTMSCMQNSDVMDILIEKADPDIPGTYQMINNTFASIHCKDFKYINREEDLGVEGLRTAKLSYHPVKLTEKYMAVPK